MVKAPKAKEGLIMELCNVLHLAEADSEPLQVPGHLLVPLIISDKDPEGCLERWAVPRDVVAEAGEGFIAIGHVDGQGNVAEYFYPDTCNAVFLLPDTELARMRKACVDMSRADARREAELLAIELYANGNVVDTEDVED